MILDTHVWSWFVSGSKELSSMLASRIKKAAYTVKIPVIVFWEFHILVDKNRIKLRCSALDFISKVDNEFPFIVEPMSR